jgi:hypothetical protein
MDEATGYSSCSFRVQDCVVIINCICTSALSIKIFSNGQKTLGGLVRLTNREGNRPAIRMKGYVVRKISLNFAKVMLIIVKR